MRLVEFGIRRGQRFLSRGDLLVKLRQLRLELGCGNGYRLPLADPRLVDVGEEGGQAVKVLLSVRVVLVVVAFGTPHRCAHPHFGDIAHAVGHILGHVLLGLSTALFCGLQKTVVAGGDLVLVRRIRQQIAGELFNRELVERFVFVE